MKRLIALVLVALMTLSLAACSSQTAKEEATSAPVEAAAEAELPSQMSIVTGNTGGTVFYIGAGMATLLSEKTPISFTSEATNVGDNFWYVTEDADTIGTVALDGLVAALEGNAGRGFEKPLDNLCLLMVGNMNIVYMMGSKDSEISSVGDLADKRCGWPSNGTSAYYAMCAIAETYGLDMEAMNISSISISEQVDAIKDGQLDFFSGAGSIPMAGITEMTTSADVNFISLDEDKFDELTAKNPAYVISTVPANTYAGQTEDVYYLSMPMVLIANKDLSEDAAYEITKTLCENTEYLGTIHAEGPSWSADQTKQFFEAGAIPFHPGAAKYYEELWG